MKNTDAYEIPYLGAAIGITLATQRNPALNWADDIFSPQAMSDVIFDVSDVHLRPLILEGIEADPDLFGPIVFQCGLRYSDVVLRFNTTVKNNRTEPFHGTMQVNTVVGDTPSDTVTVDLPTLKTRASIANEDEIIFHANRPHISMIPMGSKGAVMAVGNLLDKDTGESIGFSESNCIGWVV